MTSSITGCKRTHHIEVEQLEDADIVQHSLLLIKGRLQPPVCANAKQQQLKATLTLRREQVGEEDTEEQDQEQEQLTQLSTGGEFKLLFDLTAGARGSQNRDIGAACQLQLQCCSGSRLLHFVYEPRRSDYRVQPLYLVCRASDSDETTAESAEQQRKRCALIDLNLRLVQCIYAHKLHAAGHANRTFTLNGACRVFRSQLSCAAARQSSEDELWQHFATEILSSQAWGQQLQLKFVAFVGCTRYDGAAVVASGDYSYASIRRHLSAHAALGGGGLALFGSAYFYAWPSTFTEIGDCIRSTERVDLTRLPDESNYRRTYGGVYASTLGAVCHELGHCFDLGHTTDGVMGHGFDFLNRVLTVDQPTEHLPKRVLHKIQNPETTIAGASSTIGTRPRFTQLKLKQQAVGGGPSNQHLENYHAQRRNDSFYFAHNCAVILAQHRWLQPNGLHSNDLSNVARIRLDTTRAEIISSVPLRLIELRCNSNSLVAHYEEFLEKDEPVHRFQLPASLWHLLASQRTHYSFVLSVNGDTKRLACDTPLLETAAEAEVDNSGL
ncbi:uncharacterized protein LOC115627494 [Scaptodrosophila lebanonensis]|uniref:Uncharacterized protein LOC115627494 n=1 Tax=Drosophila lebanonensis TaxID=7225 RepID=A0A6J2TQU4_DROLE|nr:uncharacterized protein LOC115627494 [Scaptodrosophila lebanonensis]